MCRRSTRRGISARSDFIRARFPHRAAGAPFTRGAPASWVRERVRPDERASVPRNRRGIERMCRIGASFRQSKNLGERERAAALSHKNRSQRPARRERVLIFVSGNSISQSKNRFLAQFAARVFQRKTQANCGGGGRRRRIRRILRFCLVGKTAAAQIKNLRRGTRRGSLLLRPPAWQKDFFDKLKDVPNRRILLFPFVFLNTFGQCVLAISSKTGYNLNGMFSMGETCDLRKEDFHERID